MSDFYEHITAMERQERDKVQRTLLPVVFVWTIFFMGIVILIRWLIWPERTLMSGVYLIAPLLPNVFWALNYEPKITVTLGEQKLKIFYSRAPGLNSNASFSFGDIADAHIVATEDPEIRKHVIKEASGKLAIRTNKKIKRGPYMYAFFLSDEFPLPDGHQAVELKLRNGRHVLLETDDAENFIAALRKSGVGGATA